jgi:hypothetical protein
MIRHALVVSLLSVLFVSPGAIAQTADLSIAVFAPQTASPGEQVKYAVEVSNSGPDKADNIRVEPLGGTKPGAFCAYYITTLAAGTHGSGTCYMTIPQSGSGVVGATVSHSGTDPNPANNSATASVQAVAGSNLSVTMSAPSAVDPGLPFLASAFVSNSSVVADDVVVTIDLPIGSRVVTKPGNCTDTGARLVCPLGTLAPYANAPIIFSLTAPDSLSGGVKLTLNADVSAREADPHPENNHASANVDVYRMFWVGDTEGYSIGSIIQQVNTTCTAPPVPCKIGFKIYGEPAAGGFFTIRPRGPLPHVTVPVIIDGSTQTRYVGDTNPDGPEVFIDGTGQPQGTNGLDFEPCSFEVSSLAIGNFSGAGIHAATPGGQTYCTPGPRIHDSYIGVDASGTKAAPNGRGIVGDWINGGLAATILNNVISGNVRSGIWIGSGSSYTIKGNRIGLDAKGHPLGNGASGVFIGPLSRDANIRDNFIAFNHDFGVAVAPGAYATYIPANAIYANWQIGIDVGVDGPTPEKSNAPTIISAIYDPSTNTTAITAFVTPAGSFPAPSLHFYAADAPHASGYGDGQYYLGTLQSIQPPWDKPVKFKASGDLRGKWVCATETTNYYNGFLAKQAVPMGDYSGLYSTTSEFSRAVTVE